MIKLKTQKEIDVLREGGRHLAQIMDVLCRLVAPGVPVALFDERARQEAQKHGGTPAFLNYTPDGAERPFPAAVCISVNDEIVHGIPTESDYILKEGDIVTIDMGFVYQNLITDHARTVAVGVVTPEVERLLEATKEALQAGITAARLGNRMGDIGAAIQGVARKHDFFISKNLAGHGVGYAVHEDPFVPNEGKVGTGAPLETGLVIAIEPMFSPGTAKVTFDDDGYTVRTKDGSLAAHEEHTIAVTKDGPVVLTAL